MKKLLLLLFLIPNLAMAEGMVFDCRIQYDTNFHTLSGKSADELKFIKTEPYNESLQYYPNTEIIKETSNGMMYACEKNNWVLKCSNIFEDNIYSSRQTIEIGRKDLNYRMYRDSTEKKTGVTSTDFKYYGKCKVIEENQF